MSFDIYRYKHYHFVGIGGIGMSALAQMLRKLGFDVSGSDIQLGSITKSLESIGVRIFQGHTESSVVGADCVVYSSSVTKENPELKEAIRLNLFVVHRSQMLASLTIGKRTLAVSGTHGKTTTTAMLGCIFAEARKDPTVIVGGNVPQFGGNLRMGDGPEVVLEADESDASFLEYSPHRIITTNIEADHLDYFKDLDDIREKYWDFVGKLTDGGKWYVCAECPQARILIARLGGRAVTYGFGAQLDYSADDIRNSDEGGVSFSVHRKGEWVGRIQLLIPGRHNALNATAALALALEDDIAFEDIKRALESYRGTARRFDIKLSNEKIMIVDDYAHHPTEVKSTIAAARSFTQRRLLVVFQPHRYSRTLSLENEFATCFKEADELIVTDIYSAGEKPIDGVTGEHLSDIIRPNRQNGAFFASREKLLESIVLSVRDGDVVLMLGAGDVTKVAEDLKKRYA